MTYLIQYIASETNLENLFKLLSGIQVKWNKFELNKKQFLIYSSLSKAKVHARIYHYSYDELSEFPSPSIIPTMIIITDIPDTNDIYQTLKRWLDYGQTYSIPILVRREETESRDELFIQVITELMKRIDR
jgi:hypothetical protein